MFAPNTEHPPSPAPSSAPPSAPPSETSAAVLKREWAPFPGAAPHATKREPSPRDYLSGSVQAPPSPSAALAASAALAPLPAPPAPDAPAVAAAPAAPAAPAAKSAGATAVLVRVSSKEDLPLLVLTNERDEAGGEVGDAAGAAEIFDDVEEDDAYLSALDALLDTHALPSCDSV
jgi:hypothetical protein